MQKVVMKLDLHDNKHKQKALHAVSVLHGIESMSVEDNKMTVVGSADPIEVVGKLRKHWPAASIVSVGPAKEEKKEEKKDDKKPQPDLTKFMPCPPHPQMHPYYFVPSAEEDPNSCVIC